MDFRREFDLEKNYRPKISLIFPSSNNVLYDNLEKVFSKQIHLDITRERPLSNGWFVDFIKLEVRERTFYFPCYEWVDDGYITFPGDTELPQNEKFEIVKNHRKNYLADKKVGKRNQWIAKDKLKTTYPATS